VNLKCLFGRHDFPHSDPSVSPVRICAKCRDHQRFMVKSELIGSKMAWVSVCPVMGVPL
jgi:hypothetical protein